MATTHVVWTEAGVKEYDDEPVYLTRAAVKRLPHAGGDIEVLFDFRRDAVRCTPRRLASMRHGIGWLGQREGVDGEFDEQRWMLHRDGLQSVLTPSISADRVTADATHVFFATRESSVSRVTRLDPTTGESRLLAELPPHLRIVSWLDGVTEAGLVGRAFSDGRDIVWALPLAGGPVTELWSGKGDLRSSSDAVAVGTTVIAVAIANREERGILVFEGGRAGALVPTRGVARGLVVDGRKLYFYEEGNIRRLNLDTKSVDSVVPANPNGRLAAAGGLVYWREGRTLHRHRG